MIAEGFGGLWALPEGKKPSQYNTSRGNTDLRVGPYYPHKSVPACWCYCGSLEYDPTYFKHIACWFEEDSGNPKYPEMTGKLFYEFRRENGFNDPVIGVNYVDPYK